VTWWRATDSPARWTSADASLARRIRWISAQPGLEWGELTLGGDGEAWRTHLIVARIDPRRVRLELDTASTNQRAAWSVESLTTRDRSDIVFGVNAGQFVQSIPWGWVVMNGRQYLPAGTGPLSSALIINNTGNVRWLHGSLAQRDTADVLWAFQSYPTLLRNGEVPFQLRGAEGIDARHRDARLAIGQLEDGRLVVAMTRFAGLNGALDRLPFGLTTPEMAAVMGALGARDAVMLDGGISAQMIVQDRSGRPRIWSGLRNVPLGLVARRGSVH
jgi:exopolysaccharide biosynthesis protein